LIKQSRLHTNVPVLGTLTCLRDFEQRKSGVKKLEEKKRGRHLNCGLTGQASIDGQIATDISGKTTNRNIELT
jgi:hypothetical protein